MCLNFAYRLLLSLSIALASMPAQALDPALRLADYHHTIWTAKEGAPTMITTMAQTNDGWLWLGTNAGLYRFDGIRFSRFASTDGSTPLGTAISNLHATENGDLIIGYIRGGLSVLRDGKLVHLRDRSQLSASYQAEVDVDGSLWVATAQGLHRYHDGQWTAMGADQGLPVTAVINITLDHYGRLWTGDDDRLYLFDRERRHFDAVGAAPRVQAIVPAPDGRIWRGAGGQWQVLPLPTQTAPIPMPAWRAPSASSGGLFDRHGNHWALRCPAGLCRASPAQLDGLDQFDAARLGSDRFDQPWQVSSLSGNAILEDREGNIWIGTHAGLERFRHKQLIAVPVPAGEGLIEVLNDQHGRALIRSQPNGFLFQAGSSRFEQPAGLELFVSAWDGGVLRSDRKGITHLQDGRATFTPYPPGVEGKPAYLRGSRESLWLSFPGKGLFHFQDKRWTAAAQYGLTRGIVGISQAEDGIVWLAYRDGSIVRFENGKLRRFKIDDDGRLGPVIMVDARDGVVVAGEEGLAILDQGHSRILRSTDPEALAGISGLVIAPNGDRWFNARRGVIHITAQAWAQALTHPERPLALRVLDNLDGYPGSAVPLPRLSSAIRSGDGRLWFVGATGVVYLDPARIERNTVAPTVAIAPLAVAGARPRPDGGLLLPPDTSRLQIDYTALSLTIPERLRFRYRLDGVDDDWQDAGNRRSAFYTRLGPGAYRFRVIALNEDGVPSPREASVAFAIEPTLMQTGAFKLLCAILVLGAMAGLYWWRTRLLARRYADRYRERLAERERIARTLHDSLLQSVQGLVLHFHTAARRLPRDSDSRTGIESMLNQADRVMDETREELMDLRARGDDGERDLGAALASFGHALQEQFGARFGSAVSGQARALNSAAWHECQSIGREALFNAYRHAAPSQVELELLYADKELVLSIRDDGCGIDRAISCAGGRPGHWGMAGMKERALALEATLTFSDRAPAGTEIVLRVPARKAYARPARPDLRQRLRAAFAN